MAQGQPTRACSGLAHRLASSLVADALEGLGDILLGGSGGSGQGLSHSESLET